MFDDEDDYSKPEQLPIYKKGREIFDIVKTLTDLIPDDNEHLLTTKGFMLEDAANLTVKVAGAEGADLFDIRMEAATIIRKSARDLIVQLNSLDMFGFEEVQYFDLLRREVEEYRLLFIEWVSGFDKWNYVVDRWGLFNPPGISPFDADVP
ncbi:hypothetical protein FNH22_28395 [Fulvivirga sp. M361]|uniref:hypothetical protein n=1 Tax=Fulvivirga sp. M361 TaxID=2594266 RepID=UPI00117B03BE|nr:hypothetical protein [Fulvivirga sp. M361]TRX48809.1 hypothetical protein FNH22_28395 [Fulvivirga sp. M361]